MPKTNRRRTSRLNNGGTLGNLMMKKTVTSPSRLRLLRQKKMKDQKQKEEPNKRIKMKRRKSRETMIYKKKNLAKMMIMMKRMYIYWKMHPNIINQEVFPRLLLNHHKRMLLMHLCQDFSIHTFL